MADLSVNYLGLNLKNPLIVGSCGLTSTLDNITKIEKNGAGAIVLKSLFEEQILMEASSIADSGTHINDDVDAQNYIKYYVKQNSLENYLNLIKSAKESVEIPVIASINCKSDQQWVAFTKSIQEAGADALEINIFISPTNPDQSGDEIEKLYFNIINDVKKHITIPLAVKISYYFSNLSKMILSLSRSRIDGLVLFNRFFSPDIDITKKSIVSANIFSTPEEIVLPIRWTALLSEELECDLVASTGIHDGEGMAKLLLAGATCTQVATTLYNNGIEYIDTMLQQLENWMSANNYKTIDDFRGLMSQGNIEDPQQYERAQFMKYYSGYSAGII